MAKDKRFEYRSDEATAFLERWYDEVLEKWPIPYDEHRFETSFGSTYVVECGSPDGQPVVLLHGIGMNSGCWRLSLDLESLSEKNHLYLVDIIGDAGRSIINAKPKSGKFYADWMQEVFAGLELNEAILAGASFGGAISLYTAFKRPELVTKVVAMVPIAVITKVRFLAITRMLLLAFFFNPKKMISFLEYVNGGTLEIEGIQEIIDFMCNYPETKNRSIAAPIPVLKDDDLRSIDVPCVCYMAELDPFYDAEKVKQRINALKSNVEVTVVSGRGHLLGQDFTPYLNEGIGKS